VSAVDVRSELAVQRSFLRLKAIVVEKTETRAAIATERFARPRPASTRHWPLIPRMQRLPTASRCSANPMRNRASNRQQRLDRRQSSTRASEWQPASPTDPVNLDDARPGIRVFAWAPITRNWHCLAWSHSSVTEETDAVVRAGGAPQNRVRSRGTYPKGTLDARLRFFENGGSARKGIPPGDMSNGVTSKNAASLLLHNMRANSFVRSWWSARWRKTIRSRTY
jgi:hypothetical protein